MSAPIGTVYLLHFDTPFRHAKHYTGWTSNLAERLAEHASGRGARLTQVVQQAGIGWQVARTWPDTTRADERRLKNQGGAARRCPTCAIGPNTAAIRAVPAGMPEWATEHPDKGPWHWATAQPGAGATNACELCHTPKHLFEFDLSDPVRRVCWDCAGNPLPA